jgi:hypothetical protein
MNLGCAIFMLLIVQYSCRSHHLLILCPKRYHVAPCLSSRLAV